MIEIHPGFIRFGGDVPDLAIPPNDLPADLQVTIQRIEQGWRVCLAEECGKGHGLIVPDSGPAELQRKQFETVLYMLALKRRKSVPVVTDFEERIRALETQTSLPEPTPPVSEK